jgi:uncharacterized membrane protein (DUF485 family)
MSTVKQIKQKPARLDLLFNKRNNLNISFTFPMSLIGYTFYVIFYNTNKTISFEPEVIETDLINGKISVDITSNEADLLSEGQYEWYFDLIKEEVGFRRTFFAGYVNIKEGV